MRTDHYFPSVGAGQIHVCRWMPDGEVKAIVQIVHGIAEFVERYDTFAQFLNAQGIAVVAEDHMGHGKSVNGTGIKGYFHGGWFAAVDDSIKLMCDIMQEFPGVPYVIFGHSMGSFMARTILCRCPNSGIKAAVICGTGWQPRAMLPAAIGMAKMFCRKCGEEKPSELLQKLVFGGYNKKVEKPRTPYDWLSRDKKIVDAYIADPMCGFTPSCGLLRDMMMGIQFIETEDNLSRMDKKLPVFFIAGGDDPVGSYGEGVKTAAEEFRKAGMENVSQKIYPLCRHEILNEINKEEVFEDVRKWLFAQLGL